MDYGPNRWTSNLIEVIPICGTLLALMHNEQIVLGISNIPKLRQLAYAMDEILELIHA